MSEDMDIYSLAKDLIVYSKMNSPDYVPDELNKPELSDLQQEYIQGIMDGRSSKELCAMFGLSKMQPYIWKKQNPLFKEAMEFVQTLKADTLEEQMWNDALENESANPLTKMFLLKQAKPSYRENATPQGSNSVNIRISVGDNEFKVVTDTDESQE